MEPLSQRLLNTIKQLRDQVAEYDQLSEADQKQIRHTLYVGNGKFSKIVVGIFPAIKEATQELESK